MCVVRYDRDKGGWARWELLIRGDTNRIWRRFIIKVIEFLAQSTVPLITHGVFFFCPFCLRCARYFMANASIFFGPRCARWLMADASVPLSTSLGCFRRACTVRPRWSPGPWTDVCTVSESMVYVFFPAPQQFSQFSQPSPHSTARQAERRDPQGRTCQPEP